MINLNEKKLDASPNLVLSILLIMPPSTIILYVFIKYIEIALRIKQMTISILPTIPET